MKAVHVLVLTSVVFLGACSSSDELKPKEIPSSEAVNLDASQEELFDTGQKLFQKELYSVATDSYTSLRNGYPVGPYAEYAEIKLADSEFGAAAYDAAALLYENFIKDHPGSRSDAYVTFMAGRSYQLANRGVGRDAAPLQKAQEMYDRLLSRYPDSVYAQSAADHRRETLQELALYEQMVLDFYKKQEKVPAAQARAAEFEQRWAAYLNPPQPAGTDAGAPVMLAEAKPTAAELAEAKPTAAQLAEAEPAGQPMARPALGAPELLAAMRGSEQASAVLNASSRPAGAGKTGADAPPADEGVIGIQCKNSPVRMVYILLKDEEALKAAEEAARSAPLLSPAGGKVALALPGLVSRPVEKDCFGSRDLTISAEGEISLGVETRVTVMTMDNPPRLLLIPERSGG